MFDPYWLILFGFLIGILASMTGIGGGIFAVPILVFFYGETITSSQMATATSLAAIIFTAIASSFNYSRQRRIYYKTGLVLAVTSAPGSYFGAWVANRIDSGLLGMIFGVFLIVVAARMVITMIKKKKEDSTLPVKTDSELVQHRRTLIIGLSLGFFGGFASGLLGIGGGTLIVPIMTFGLGMPMFLATATSMFTMIITATAGSIQNFQQGVINLPFALLLALGTVVGAQVGASTSRKMSNRSLTFVFAAVLIAAGVNMLIKYYPQVFA
jgi:uncharacterized membrane protein YfcA